MIHNYFTETSNFHWFDIYRKWPPTHQDIANSEKHVGLGQHDEITVYDWVVRLQTYLWRPENKSEDYLQWLIYSTPSFSLFNTPHHLLFLPPNYSTPTLFLTSTIVLFNKIQHHTPLFFLNHLIIIYNLIVT